MAALPIILAAAYASAAGLIAWRAHTDAARTPRPHNPPQVSVLIAARNEEDAIGPCLEALSDQSYPPDRLEVVVADDHSSDGTAAVAERAGVRCIRLQGPDAAGKAAALHAAYSAARGDILLTTDADCRPPRNWVRNLAAQFDDPDAGVVCGVTSVRQGDRLSAVQALDWALLLTIAAGLSALGKPLTAMGNNMGFRREAYEAVGGFASLPYSVTEDYTLFRAVRRHARWRVRLVLDASLENRTEPLRTLRDVFSQRRRWARGGLHTGPAGYLLYLFVWMVHASIAAGLILAPGAGLAALAVKSGADAAVLHTAARHVTIRRPWARFPLFEAYLFGYLILLPFSLAAAPTISWRGRHY